MDNCAHDYILHEQGCRCSLCGPDDTYGKCWKCGAERTWPVRQEWSERIVMNTREERWAMLGVHMSPAAKGRRLIE